MKGKVEVVEEERDLKKHYKAFTPLFRRLFTGLFTSFSISVHSIDNVFAKNCCFALTLIEIYLNKPVKPYYRLRQKVSFDVMSLTPTSHCRCAN